MEPLRYAVPAENAGCTVQHILITEFLMSRSHISRLKRREGGILLNGKSCYSTTRCQEGDTVTALISDPPDTPRLEPCDMELEIVYEDEWLIVPNKPAGVSVHPERSGVGGSLENALSARFREDEFCHTVSRLDRGTSGLMTVAKCGYMHERMRGLLHTESFVKRYIGIAEGVPQSSHGFVELPLEHVPGSNYMMHAAESGAESLTEYEVLGVNGGLSLLRLIPHTGRMHQLRVHMAAIGCPLAGDWLYGTPLPELPGRFALHSAHLAFTHPLTGKYLSFDSPLPEGLSLLLEE